MATIVLTVAGGLIGGPIGAAIGSVVGGVIDREVLFKPKGREGPRLSELKLQTSSYGTQIPRLFGTMRVAGSVIWATELNEHRSTSGGKGRPSTTTYSYSASFAVALSARPILSVARIWADGKLLRGSAGDWKTRTGFRLHRGSEDQMADPLIAAAEGAGMAPAHRGIAYAVFEDLELADFGNRIPSLTFEVTADSEPVAAGTILHEIAGEVSAGEDTPLLGGFSAHGASVRAVAETLAGAAGAWFRSNGAGLALLRGAGPAVALGDMAARAEGKRSERGRARRAIAAADSAPRTLTLTHYDPARDYQSGVQRAGRPGAGSRETRLELAAVLDAGAAKTIAEQALARYDVERERRTLALGWDRIGVRPGERVTISGAPGLWRVERWSLEAMVLTLECVRVSRNAMAADASGGRVLPAPDEAIGTTVVHAFELPPLGDVVEGVPRLAIAAAGTEPGWRSAALLTSSDGGAHWVAAGQSAGPAVLGSVTLAPGAGPATIEDRANAIEVTLAHEAMTLADAEAAALDAGVNLAMVGDELIQFGRAEPLGDARWRLTGLWRGRRGTEAAIGAHATGERFVLIEADTLAVRDLPAVAIGGTVEVLAQGVGDSGEAAESGAAIAGIGIVPPAPMHLRDSVLGDGSTRLTWVRRSRIGWRWRDGMDVPLGEERERYQVMIAPEGGAPRIEDVDQAEVSLAAGDRASAVTIMVRQIGTHGLSRPATRTLPAIGGD